MTWSTNRRAQKYEVTLRFCSNVSFLKWFAFIACSAKTRKGATLYQNKNKTWYTAGILFLLWNSQKTTIKRRLLVSSEDAVGQKPFAFQMSRGCSRATKNHDTWQHRTAAPFHLSRQWPDLELLVMRFNSKAWNVRRTLRTLQGVRCSTPYRNLMQSLAFMAKRRRSAPREKI